MLSQPSDYAQESAPLRHAATAPLTLTAPSAPVLQLAPPAMAALSPDEIMRRSLIKIDTRFYGPQWAVLERLELAQPEFRTGAPSAPLIQAAQHVQAAAARASALEAHPEFLQWQRTRWHPLLVFVLYFAVIAGLCVLIVFLSQGTFVAVPGVGVGVAFAFYEMRRLRLHTSWLEAVAHALLADLSWPTGVGCQALGAQGLVAVVLNPPNMKVSSCASWAPVTGPSIYVMPLATP